MDKSAWWKAILLLALVGFCLILVQIVRSGGDIRESEAGDNSSHELALDTLPTTVVIGSVGDSGLLEADEEGRALLAFRPSLPLSADQYGFLTLSLDFSPILEVAFAWRQQDSPHVIHRTAMPVDGSSLKLHEHPQWRGDIIEMMMVVEPIYGGVTQSSARQLQLDSALLKSHLSVWDVLVERLVGASAFRGWNSRSVNSLRTSPAVPVLLVWVLISAILGAVIFRRHQMVLLVMLCGGGFGWVALDALWLHQLSLQNQATRDQFAGVEAEQRRYFDVDWPLAAFLDPIIEFAEDSSAVRRVLVVTPESYYGKRAAYHLLPLPAVWWPNAKALVRPRVGLARGDVVAVFDPERDGEVAGILSNAQVEFRELSRHERGVILLVTGRR